MILELPDGPLTEEGYPLAPSPNDDPLKAALFHAARMDLWAFIEIMFPVLHPGQQFMRAPYLELMATVLMGVYKGRYRRPVFNLPPRHMKSVITSVLYPAWVLGRNPGAKFICISYSDELAHDLSVMTRTVMKSPLYRAIFPQTVLRKEAQDHIKTSKGGYRLATAVGSVITGFGADTIIIDDPLQPEDALSESKKANFKKWFASSVITRFNNPGTGALILVMHRLSQDDPSSDLLKSSDCALVLPLIAGDEPQYSHKGRVILARKPGDVLNPRLYPPDTVASLREMLANHVFQSQYQQAPILGGSGMFNVATWPRYEPSSTDSFELLIQSWDIGATVSGNASVCTTWGLRKDANGKDAIYLHDLKRLKVELPEVEAAIKVAEKQFRPALVVLDENGVGLGVYQRLKREGYKNVLPSKATKENLEIPGQPGHGPSPSKIDRFGKAILEIAEGRVLIPNEATWLPAFLTEVAGFPSIPDKDQVDSLSQIAGNLNRVIHLARQNKVRLKL